MVRGSMRLVIFMYVYHQNQLLNVNKYQSHKCWIRGLIPSYTHVQLGGFVELFQTILFYLITSETHDMTKSVSSSIGNHSIYSIHRVYKPT